MEKSKLKGSLHTNYANTHHDSYVRHLSSTVVLSIIIGMTPVKMVAEVHVVGPPILLTLYTEHVMQLRAGKIVQNGISHL